MGKARDKVTIFPSTTRRGTTLSTSTALDSPSIMSKLLTPPHPNASVISAESGNSSDNSDDASTVLDKSGSLHPFLDTELLELNELKKLTTLHLSVHLNLVKVLLMILMKLILILV